MEQMNPHHRVLGGFATPASLFDTVLLEFGPHQVVKGPQVLHVKNVRHFELPNTMTGPGPETVILLVLHWKN